MTRQGKQGGDTVSAAGQTDLTPPGKASDARGGATRRGRFSRATRAGAQYVTANPLAAVGGAVAISAGLALLLPSTRREAEVMGDIAGTLGDLARGAADTAVEAGLGQVETLAQEALAGVGSTVVEAVLASSSGGSGER